MKRILRLTLVGLLFSIIYSSNVNAQAIKTNIPLIVTGNPNIGVEWTVGKQLTLNGDVLWAPYLFKKNEEVFRALIGSVDFRYYIKPKFYYTNDIWDGLYIGPYAMAGNFNIGLIKSGKTKEESWRRKGWGLSTGVIVGYKFYLSERFRLEANINLGYAHMQYDKYKLGGMYSHYPEEKKKTKSYIGPTKLGINLVYNIFR